MKKLLSAVLVTVVMAMVTVTVHANTFTFNQDSLLKFWDLEETGNTEWTGLSSRSAQPNNSVWFETPMSALDQSSSYAKIFIGANDSGTSPFVSGTHATVADIGATDLTGFDKYSLTVKNVNQSQWDFRLRLDALNTSFFSDAWVTLLPGQAATLVLDLPQFIQEYATNFVSQIDWNVKAIGLEVQGNMIGDDQNEIDPSLTDAAHFVVGPIPEPGTMILMGTGLLGFITLRKRSM